MAKRGRIPRPWHRAGTDSWYVTLDGRQILLGKTKREAHAEFARIMNARGQGVTGGGRITVADLAGLWLDDCARRLAETTVDTYRKHIDSFVAASGGLQVRDLKPFHIQNWLAGTPFGQSTRHLAITVVKCLVQWGEEQGYLDSNPIRRLKRPGITRRAPITVDEAGAVMACVPPRIRTALQILLAMGIRPGELCSLEAWRIDVPGRQATVRGKRGERTVPISDAALGLLEPLLSEHPEGPLLWSARGRLTVGALERCLDRARPRACKILGRGPDGCDHVTPHCFRGLFSTEALRRGVDSALVSQLLGHSDPSILMKHYASPDRSMLAEAMERATHTPRSSGDSPPAPPE